MAKRFTDSDKWKKNWFRKLTPAHKCFWNYLLDNCNSAGIWDVDFESAAFHIGEEIDGLEIMEIFQKQFFPFAGGKRWFLIDFIDFQYVELKSSSNAHVSVINILKKYGLFEIYLAHKKAEQDRLYENQAVLRDPRGVQEQEEDKEQDQAMDKEKDKDLNLNLKTGKDTIATDVPIESVRATKTTLLKSAFDDARREYPGTKGGLTVEWENFERKNRGKVQEIIPLLVPAILAEKIHKDALNKTRSDPLAWKHFQTWINKRCWEQELENVKEQNANTGNWTQGRHLGKHEKNQREFSESLTL